MFSANKRIVLYAAHSQSRYKEKWITKKRIMDTE